MNRLLLVEDDPHLGYILKEYLSMHEFEVELATDGEMGKQVFEKRFFDMIILDVMMPEKDGFTLAQEIKAHNPYLPIIFLTAKSLKVDKLKGFKLGCDDYIVKPVDEEELIARIKAVLKRSHSPQVPKEEFQIGSFTFNPKNQQLYADNFSQKLTQKESRVLHLLCSSMGEITESQHILKTLWGESDYFNRRSMDVYISRLRKYLKDDPKVQIINVHGKGYILEG
ncbi:MAG: response regulator transcription factor [Bacteroidia bacterium]